MGSRNLFLLILVLMFSLTMVFAQPVYEQETNITLSVPCIIDGSICNASTTCIGTIINPDGMVLYNEQPMTQNNALFELYLNQTDSSTIGEYLFSISCTQGTNSASKNLLFTVTSTGQDANGTTFASIIFLTLLFIGLILLVYSFSKKINHSRWHEKMMARYKEKNYLKFGASILVYNLMKNTYVIYYFIGLVLMGLITDLVRLFNLINVLPLIELLTAIYTWSALIVAIILFSQVQEWLIKWKKDIENLKWGEYNN